MPVRLWIGWLSRKNNQLLESEAAANIMISYTQIGGMVSESEALQIDEALLKVPIR